MNQVLFHISSALNSYSQIFFSKSKFLSILLFFVTLLDFWAGLCGLLSVIIVNLAADILGFNKYAIKKGLFGFNALLTGLGVGLYYEPSIGLYIVVIFVSLFVLMVTLVIKGILSKYSLPFLSTPFLLGIWLVVLAAGELHNLGLSERGIYVANELYTIGGSNMLAVYDWFNNLNIPEALSLYFLSLGAIFFQYTIFSGILISIGLLICSRITFTLSLLGYFVAMIFYNIIGADFTSLNYSYIGFNYILTAIAIGGFFLVPSLSSYLSVVILLPIVVLITISCQSFFTLLGLPVYSLPFNIIVISFLYSLKIRERLTFKLREVVAQHFQPEKNVYHAVNQAERFKNNLFYPITLPFWGEWNVSQGHKGKYTHKDEWKHAWDFIIKDEKNKEFKNNGDSINDYHCYGKNIIAPGYGYVVELIDEVEDNKIGNSNLHQNWGNSIVIKHTEYLYSQMSHLKKGSFKVKKGDYVAKGDILAQVGNSGRSPYPHLHFQLQATPYIGSKTIDYPIYNYLKIENNNYQVESFNKPSQDEVISNPPIETLMEKAFNFTPGKTLKFILKQKDKSDKNIEWQVNTDIMNNIYLYCSETNSYAYFFNNKTVHYFIDFTGDKSSFLFYFQSILNKVQLAYYKDMELKTVLPPNYFFSKFILFFQDFVAPFFIYLKSNYKLSYISIDDDFSPSKILLKTTIQNNILKKKINEIDGDILITENGIEEIIIKKGKKEMKLIWKK